MKDRVDFMATKWITAYKVTFHPEKAQGIDRGKPDHHRSGALKSAVRNDSAFGRVWNGDYVYLAQAGEQFGDYYIPPGKIGLGTVCV